MAYEELFTDLLKAEREEDMADALTVFGLEEFSDSNWPPRRDRKQLRDHRGATGRCYR